MTDLADIKKGDSVTVLRDDAPIRILTVDRATAATITTGDKVWLRKTGGLRGAREWHRSFITPTTEQHRYMIRIASLRYRLRYLEQHDVDALTDEQVQTIAEWLDAGKP